MDKNNLNNLLPNNYWKIIDSLTERVSLDNKKPLFGIVIPSFGESRFIKGTLENLIIKQRNVGNIDLLLIPVYKLTGEADKTFEMITTFMSKHPDIQVLPVDEATFPDTTCIGHARAIGFGIILALATKNNITFDKTFLISSDADMVDIDPYYLSKIKDSFMKKEKYVVSCENRLSDNAMKNIFLKFLKTIEDGFFFGEYFNIGALNGRCYALKGDTYISSGGVDYQAQFDDISFGIKVHKVTPIQKYDWIDSYVVTSERRFFKSMQTESLMSGYAQKEALGNHETLKVPFENYDKLEGFILEHINEGFNTFLYYYAKRYPYNKEKVQNFYERLDLFIKYINQKLSKLLIIKNLDHDHVLQMYRDYSNNHYPNEWWKQHVDYELIIIGSESILNTNITTLIENSLGMGAPDHINDISPPGNKMNRIFKIDLDNSSYLLKLFENNDPLIGEENLFDAMYDLYTHKTISERTGIFTPCRNLIDYAESSSLFEGKPFLLSTFVPGKTLDTFQNGVISEKLMEVLRSILRLNKILGIKDHYGSKYILEMIQNLFGIDRNFLSKLNERVSQESRMLYESHYLRYFKNDIERDYCNGEYASKLIEIIDESLNFMNIDSFYLIHADIKPKNIIINDKKDTILIDWSRSTYGDMAVDFADIIVSMEVYAGIESALEALFVIRDLYIKEIYDVPASFFKRIKFYMAFKEFSIARVFYPKDMDAISENIISNWDKDIEGFINGQKAIYKKFY